MRFGSAEQLRAQHRGGRPLERRFFEAFARMGAMSAGGDVGVLSQKPVVCLM